MKKGESRRGFIKKTALLSAVVGSGALNGCAGVKPEEPKLDGASKKILEKPVGEITEKEIKDVRKAFSKKYYSQFKKAYDYKGDGKWKIKILGSCAGSEPSENHMFTSWVLEKPNGDLVWFDCGECCAQTATLMGMNILRAKHMFISHPHSDHIGGLGGFIHTGWAMHRITKKPFDFTVHVSTEKSVKGGMWLVSSGRDLKNVKVDVVDKDGEIYNDGELSVEALGNLHMPKTKDGKHVSYSYRIKLLKDPKKTIIFTGDIRALDELAPFLNDGCDLLMMENGHHYPNVVCKNLNEKYPGKVKELMIMHLNPGSIHNREFEKPLAEKYWGKPIIFADDRMVLEV